VLLARVDRAKPASDSNPTAGKPATVHAGNPATVDSAAHGEAH